MMTIHKISGRIITRQFTVYVLTILFCIAANAQESMMENDATPQMEATDTAQEQAAPAAASQTANDSTIARAQFTTAIVDREPTDDIVMLSNDVDKVYFFTEIVNAQGETYTHRWEYEGQQMAEVSFAIGSPRWRAYSSKNIKPEWTGMWTVTVLDSAGNPLKVASFEVVEAKPANQ